MKKELISFSEYKNNCEYHHKVRIDRKQNNGSFISCPPIYSESCIHPLAGKRDAITSKTCNEHNDFCPYNEVN